MKIENVAGAVSRGVAGAVSGVVGAVVTGFNHKRGLVSVRLHEVKWGIDGEGKSTTAGKFLHGKVIRDGRSVQQEIKSGRN